MLLAANLSGKAINISRTTAPHAVSYPFTAHYGISHGQAVSITLMNFSNTITKIKISLYLNLILKIDTKFYLNLQHPKYK